jgi:hypothetical protein
LGLSIWRSLRQCFVCDGLGLNLNT